jgi:hypothetical protein
VQTTSKINRITIAFEYGGAKWWQFIGITSNVNAWWYVLYQLFVVVAIFSICVIIDCIRKQLFKVCRIDSAIKKLFDKIESTGMLLIHRW